MEVKMRFLKLTILSFFLIGIAGPRSFAQGRNEVGFSVGAGSLQVDPGGGATVVSSFSYQVHLSRHFSVEGAIESFNYKVPAGPSGSTYKDDYLGAEAAVVYDLLPNL